MSVHRHVFTALVKERGFRTGAELGVDKGILFAMLLKECPDLTLIGVDTFPDRDRSRRAFQTAARYRVRGKLWETDTITAAGEIADRSLDFVFIDADHRYAAVRDDIAAWSPKVRPGGWFGGHDYDRRFPGVIQAVNLAFGRKRIETLPGSIWSVSGW